MAATTYHFATDVFRRAGPAVQLTKDECEVLLRKTNEAHLEAERASAALNNHIAEHGC